MSWLVSRAAISLEQGEGCGVMSLLLAVSKAGPSAKGVRRTWACASPSALCPVIAAKAV